MTIFEKLSIAPSRSMDYRAESDLATRTRWSTLAFFAIFLIVLWFTPYYSEHPVTLLVTGAILLIGSVTRIYLSLNFDNIYRKSDKLWKLAFLANIVWLALTWGVFCMITVMFYQLEWTGMLVILATAGFAAGAAATLSIRYYQIAVQLSAMLLPTTVSVLSLASREAMAISLIFLIYTIFLLMVAKRHNTEYWTALKNEELLQLRAAELEASNNELESYSYSIAHDLRAPLRSIVSYSQILQTESKQLNREEKDFLNRVIEASKFMARLIDDILELSRITRSKLHKDSVDLSKLADNCADQLSKQEPNHPVEWYIQPGLITEGDSRLLYVALQNLINNSWKFTYKNKTTARIQFGSEIKEDKLTYYVKDNGIGFDTQYSNKIFSPFERLNTDYDGTGIGLATVARVVHRHGGEVWAESKKGEGATFYFTL